MPVMPMSRTAAMLLAAHGEERSMAKGNAATTGSQGLLAVGGVPWLGAQRRVRLCGRVVARGHRTPGATRRRAGTCASDALQDVVAASVVALTVVVVEMKAQTEVFIRSMKM